MTWDDTPQLLVDFVYAKLAAALDTAATTVVVDDVSTFPLNADLAQRGFWMTIESPLSTPNTFEIVRVTNVDVTTNTLTFVRGERSGVSAHASGTYIKSTVSAEMLRRLSFGYSGGSLPPVDLGLYNEGDRFYNYTDHRWYFLNGTAWVPFGSAPTNVAPTAAFTFVATGLTVNFDGTTSTDGDGTIVSYYWNFGDAGGDSATRAHTYASAGTYTAYLTVTDDGGLTGTVSHDVTVTAPVTGPPPPSYVGTVAAPYPGTEVVAMPLPAGSLAGDVAVIATTNSSATNIAAMGTMLAWVASSAQGNVGLGAAAYILTASDILAGHVNLPVVDMFPGGATMTVFRGVGVDTANIHTAAGSYSSGSVTPSGAGFLFAASGVFASGGTAAVGSCDALSGVASAGSGVYLSLASGYESYTTGASTARTWNWVGSDGRSDHIETLLIPLVALASPPPPTGPTFVGSSSMFSVVNPKPDLNVPLPTGTQADDLLLVAITAYVDNTWAGFGWAQPTNPPADSTLRGQSTKSSNLVMSVYSHVVTSGDVTAGTYLVPAQPAAGAHDQGAVLHSYRNASIGLESSGHTPPVTPGLTATADGFLYSSCIEGPRGVTPTLSASGVTAIEQFQTNNLMGAAGHEAVASGATTSVTWIQNGGDGYQGEGGAVALLIDPPPPPPPPPTAFIIGAVAAQWLNTGSNIDLPAGSEAGDLALLTYLHNTTDISPVYGTTIATAVISAGGWQTLVRSYVLQAADITAGHLVLPAATYGTGATLVVYRGVTVDAVGVSSTFTTPSITPTGPAFLHHFSGAAAGGAPVPSGSMSALDNVVTAGTPGEFGTASGTEVYSGTGATTPRTWTWVNSNNNDSYRSAGVIALLT